MDGSEVTVWWTDKRMKGKQKEADKMPSVRGLKSCHFIADFRHD